MGNFSTCGPNEAMVVSGCCHSTPKMIPGGSVWVWGIVQRLQRISLNTMTLLIESNNVYTAQGVLISCLGVAQVKVQGQNQEMLESACVQFLDKSVPEIETIALQTMEGHQRAIIGRMTVEDIYKDRQKFATNVFETASTDLVQMGITVVSYTIKDIRDSNGYLEALGRTRTAQVLRDAVIGEARSKRDSGIKIAKGKQEHLKVQYEKDTEIAAAKRDYDLKKATYTIEVETKRAESEMAYQQQAAVSQQAIKEAEMLVIIEERNKEIQIQDQEILRREKELESQIKKPAEAEKYRLETIACAEHNKVVLEAEANAQAIQMRGAAQAYAIEAKAKAEAEQMAKKAEAWKGYQEAAKVEMILKALPKIASEVAGPLSRSKKVTMISSGDGDVGASKLTGEVINVMGMLPTMIEDMTGVNISHTMVKSQRAQIC